MSTWPKRRTSHDLNVREMAERTREQAETARIQAIRASELPALRDAEARAAAGLQRLTNAREMLDREEQRAKERVTELDRRLTQFSSDIAREQQQTADAQVALLRLDTEDAELKEEIKSGSRRAAASMSAWPKRKRPSPTPSACSPNCTTALADMTAKRNQLEASVRSHRDRLARLNQEILNVQAEQQKLAQETEGLGDLAALAEATENAQQYLAQSEAAAQASEAAHVAARARLEASRAPLAEADKRVQRLETEARTIAKLVNGETKNLWPPIIDGVTVAKGYEKALGAALGDDLDAPIDPTAPMRWSRVGAGGDDPALPAGVEPLAAHVQAPPELARRLAQIGVVAKERGGDLVSQLKTGQRLVSPEGDVWRWDGFVTAAHAPTGAARRLAERARLVDIESELEQARARCARQTPGARNRRKPTEGRLGAESAAREAWRAAQREADAAREQHAAPSASSIATPDAYRRSRRPIAASAPIAPRPTPPMRTPSPPSTRCRPRSRPKAGSPRCAATSRAVAATPRRCGPRRRRWRGRPNSPTAALQAITAERNEWRNRARSAASQVETIEARLAETHRRARRAR